MYYLSNANNTDDERFKFLSYYQVMEYFFVRVQNYYFLDKLKSIDISYIFIYIFIRLLSDSILICRNRAFDFLYRKGAENDIFSFYTAF